MQFYQRDFAWKSYHFGIILSQLISTITSPSPSTSTQRRESEPLQRTCEEGDGSHIKTLRNNRRIQAKRSFLQAIRHKATTLRRHVGGVESDDEFLVTKRVKFC